MLTIIPDKNDLLLNRRSYFNQLRFIRTKAPLSLILVVLLVDKFQLSFTVNLVQLNHTLLLQGWDF